MNKNCKYTSNDLKKKKGKYTSNGLKKRASSHTRTPRLSVKSSRWESTGLWAVRQELPPQQNDSASNFNNEKKKKKSLNRDQEGAGRGRRAD